MSGFIAGADRRQATAFPELLDDYVDEESVNRVIDAFVDEMDLLSLGFKTNSADTGRPGFHPSTMLKLFIYDYMNPVQSSHRLDGSATLQDQDVETRQHRDELACVGLQLKTCHPIVQCCRTDRKDANGLT